MFPGLYVMRRRRIAAAGFDPTLEAPSGWWEADSGTAEYDGAPWAGTASAGTSGANGALLTGGNVPSIGAAQNGHVAARLTSVNAESFVAAAATSALLTVSAFSIIVVLKLHSTVAAASDFYDDPGVVIESNGNLGLVVNGSGVRAGAFIGGASKQTVAIPFGTGTYGLICMRFDGAGNVDCSLGGTDATPVAATGNIPALGATAIIGRNYASVKYVDASVAAILTWQSRISTVLRDSYRTHYGTKLATAL